MISEVCTSSHDESGAVEDRRPPAIVLARYGAVPQVARFAVFEPLDLQRGMPAVAETDRGEEIVAILHTVPVRDQQDQAQTGRILRSAAPDDLQLATDRSAAANRQFPEWLRRIREWKLQLEMIDLEQTLDGRLILYVLSERNAETTRLALLTAANGLGIVHVQPVTADGVVAAAGDGGCGSCGCGT